MLIAQHSVAGEGHFCPAAADARPDDQAARFAFEADTPNLPWIIFRAAFRAAHLPDLPTRARSLLAALARTVDAARPYAAIFARRELLTGRAMQSMRTFYRSLDDLETAGLVARETQQRYGDAGLFGRAYLRLTPAAALLLGLVAEESAPATPEPERPDTSAATADTFAAPVLPADSLTPPSAKVADRAIYKDLYPNTQKRQPGTLPADLQRLLSLGFRRYFVFKLMREAKATGKFLSDVVNACWESIRTARAPIAYVRALLASHTDFAYLARTQADAALATSAAAHEQARLQRIAARAAGATFYDRGLTRQLSVSTDGATLMIQHHDEARPRVNAGAWWREFGAALEAGELCPSTDTLAAKFAGKRQSASPSVSTPASASMHRRAAAAKPAQARAVPSSPLSVPAPPSARQLTPAITDQLRAMRRLLQPLAVTAR
jgi:hypothetical protein